MRRSESLRKIGAVLTGIVLFVARFVPSLSAQQSDAAAFVPADWQLRGWDATAEGMMSIAGEATALHRRTFQRLMLECDVEPLADVITPLRLRLHAAETKTTVTVAVGKQTLIVTDDSRAQPRVIKHAALAPELSPQNAGRLRVAATGNRLVISWNGKVALTCDQPAGQSGRPAQIELLADRTPYRITALRLEGE